MPPPLSFVSRSQLRAIAFLLWLSASGFAAQATSLGDPTDDPAVRNVQATWSRADALMSRGNYKNALAELNRGNALLPLIKIKLFRDCVSDGAQQRIVMAKKGQAYLLAHHGDLKGADRTAQLAFKNFHSKMTSCP